jgi:hypothetical protein
MKAVGGENEWRGIHGKVIEKKKKTKHHLPNDFAFHYFQKFTIQQEENSKTIIIASQRFMTVTKRVCCMPFRITVYQISSPTIKYEGFPAVKYFHNSDYSSF